MTLGKAGVFLFSGGEKVLQFKSHRDVTYLTYMTIMTLLPLANN